MLDTSPEVLPQQNYLATEEEAPQPVLVITPHIDEETHDELLVDAPIKRNKKPFSPLGVSQKDNFVDPKHRVILEKMKEGVPLKQAMAEVGYSGGSLNSPNFTLGKTKSWQNLMDEYIPEATLAARHNELLNMRSQQKVLSLDGTVVELKDVPDANTVSKALEMAYKLRGAFKEAAAPAKSQTIYNLFYKPEVRAQVSAFEDNLKQAIFNDASKQAALSSGEADSSATDTGDAIDIPAE